MTTDVDERMIEPDPEIATWLRQAEPRVTADDETLAAHLVTMTVATTREEKGAARRRQGIAAAVLTPVLLLGGAGAAFAATTIDWSSFWGNGTTEWAEWAKNPDARITYSLPGGGSCELRLGEFEYSPDPNRPADVAADPQSVAAALDYLHSADVLADADVEGVLRENRSDQNFADDGSGKQVPFGYGTDNYNADVEYSIAVKEAVHKAIEAHLESLGIPSTGLGFQG